METAGKVLPYGILVLVVELAGATTVAIYAVNLLFVPLNERAPPDPARPGLPAVSLPYHVRILVPCYKEDLEIVQAWGGRGGVGVQGGGRAAF